MRFNCLVEVRNTADQQSKPKIKSTLTLGGYGAGQDPSSLWILHQTAQNQIGVQYKVDGNIKRLFVRFVYEGKFAIRFRKPEVDFLVSTEPRHSKKFVDILSILLDPKTRSPSKWHNVTNLATTSDKCDPGPVKVVIIKSVQEFQDMKGSYPSTVECLEISNANLEKIEPRIFRLEHLQMLRFDNNRILTVPSSIELCQNLTELYLGGNKLGATRQSWEWLKCRSLCNSLRVLDLSSNEITRLPNFLPRLKALRSLVVHSNKLVELPNNMGLIKRLVNLEVNNNSLRWLPVSMRCGQLSNLDVSGNIPHQSNFPALGNPFQPYQFPGYEELISPPSKYPSLYSLKDWAARAVVNYRLPYGNKTLPKELISYLESACFCLCGSSSYPSKITNFRATHISRLSVHTKYGDSPYVLLAFRSCPSKRCQVH